MKKYLTKSPGQTKKLGNIFAKKILKRGIKKTAVILGLQGDLGGGKTTFLQGFARELGIKEKILSPTFIIQKRFRIKGNRFKNFYHLDCYRAENAKDILVLGFKEMISDSQNIIAIEWAEKILKVLPKSTIWIKFKFVDNKKRIIAVKI